MAIPEVGTALPVPAPHTSVTARPAARGASAERSSFAAVFNDVADAGPREDEGPSSVDRPRSDGRSGVAARRERPAQGRQGQRATSPRQDDVDTASTDDARPLRTSGARTKPASSSTREHADADSSSSGASVDVHTDQGTPKPQESTPVPVSATSAPAEPSPSPEGPAESGDDATGEAAPVAAAPVNLGNPSASLGAVGSYEGTRGRGEKVANTRSLQSAWNAAPFAGMSANSDVPAQTPVAEGVESAELPGVVSTIPRDEELRTAAPGKNAGPAADVRTDDARRMATSFIREALGRMAAADPSTSAQPPTLNTATVPDASPASSVVPVVTAPALPLVPSAQPTALEFATPATASASESVSTPDSLRGTVDGPVVPVTTQRGTTVRVPDERRGPASWTAPVAESLSTDEPKPGSDIQAVATDNGDARLSDGPRPRVAALAPESPRTWPDARTVAQTTASTTLVREQALTNAASTTAPAESATVHVPLASTVTPAPLEPAPEVNVVRGDMATTRREAAPTQVVANAVANSPQTDDDTRMPVSDARALATPVLLPGQSAALHRSTRPTELGHGRPGVLGSAAASSNVTNAGWTDAVAGMPNLPGATVGDDAGTESSNEEGSDDRQRHARVVSPNAASQLFESGMQSGSPDWTRTPVSGGASAPQARVWRTVHGEAIPTGPLMTAGHASVAIAAFQAAAASAREATTQALSTVAAAQTAVMDEVLPSQIVQAIRLRADNSSGQVHMRLNPGYLGEISVDVRMNGATVVASVQAANPDVREWMRTNEVQLRQTLAEQGLHLEPLVIADDDAPREQESADERRRRQPEQDSRERRPRRSPDAGTFEVLL